MQFLQQKAKGDWLRDGDLNTKIFHRSIKKRQLQNAIFSIHNEAGVWVDKPQEVNAAFLEYYENLLGSKMENRKSVKTRVVNCGPLVIPAHCEFLYKPVNRKEVKQALLSIHGDRAPGLDGFGSQFFKDCWQIVGSDIIDAVVDFFHTGRLLKEVNSASITLIPKISCPSHVGEYRPISCCNVIYKCITKVLCNRLRDVLPDIDHNGYTRSLCT